jgi:hypothetical protein
MASATLLRIAIPCHCHFAIAILPLASGSPRGVAFIAALAGFAQCAVEGRLKSPLREDDDDSAPDPVPLVPPCATVPPGLAGTAGRLEQR